MDKSSFTTTSICINSMAIKTGTDIRTKEATLSIDNGEELSIDNGEVLKID